WAAVAGQVPIGTLPRSWVLIEHIAFSFLRTAWRCAMAASCKRYATRGLSHAALGLPERGQRARRDADRAAGDTSAPRRWWGAGFDPAGPLPAPQVAGEVDGVARKAGRSRCRRMTDAAYDVGGRRRREKRSGRQADRSSMTDPALMARPGVPGRASVRCSPESCRSPRARRRTVMRGLSRLPLAF